MEDSSPQLLQVVSNALIRDLAVALDQQLIAGDGTGQNILGLRNIGGYTAGPSTGANGAPTSFTLLAQTVAAYEGANLDPERGVFFMNARTWGEVRALVDSAGRPLVSIDPLSALTPTLWGHKVFISNNLPITETQGTSTNCSTVLMIDMSQVYVAVSRQPEMRISQDVYFASDQLGLKVTSRFDLGVPAPAAIVKTVGLI